MDFPLPEIGEGVYEAELVAWQVKPGDAVKRGQILMEVLTDKATMEVPAPFAGTIAALRAEPGEQLKVGQVVLSYTASGAPSAVPAKEEERVPSEKKKGSARRRAPASAAVKEGGEAPATLKGGNGPTMPLPSEGGVPASAVKAAPSVRFMARKLGLDLTHVKGSGPDGRILIEDLTAHLPPSTQHSALSTQHSALSTQHLHFGSPGTRLKLQGLRRKIAEHMVHAKRTIPHYSYVDECDVSELVRLRASVRARFAQAGLKLTYLAFFVKAVTQALKEVPIVNASLDEEAGEIVLHDRYHIGLAVATPQGLTVPVVHDADRKDLAQIARAIDRLSTEARSGKAKLDDLKGGTFTITSIGSIGGLISTPVIHHPEVGILGIGKVVKRPVYDSAGNLRPADVVYLSFSFDHRVVDGAIGAAFGNAVIRQLQNPAALLLPEKLS